MATKTTSFPNKIWAGGNPCPQPISPATLFSFAWRFSVGDLDTHDRIMRLLASYSQSAGAGIHYPLHLKRVFRKR
ncbi:hypothetical protein ACLB1S_07940 [Escherichia coli]